MQIKIENIAIHILNSAEKLPVLSTAESSLNENLKNYLSSTIEKTFFSDDTKICEFKSNTQNIWSQCKDISWNLISISQSIAREIFLIMSRNGEISSADLVFGICGINSLKYFFMLKFDYRVAFTHIVKSSKGGALVDLIQHQSLFPPQSLKLTEGFLIDMKNPSVRINERKYTVDGIKDFYLSTQVLGCAENSSPRQKTTKLLQVAEKIADLYYDDKDEMSIHISATIHDELRQGQSLSVEKLGQRFFSKNPMAQEEFFERLSALDISRDEELTLSERFQRKFQRQAIRTSSGVEIKIPTQLYSDVNEIEFINNPDGTISLLIKNIML